MAVILARRDLPKHMEELAKNKIETIDMVVINLYPFVQTVAKAGVTLQDALENIDIGGPTMIRAAAKNFPSVLVIVDPADYAVVLEKLKKGTVDMQERRRLAQKAFQHVAMYDTAISQYLRDEGVFPQDLTIAMKKIYDLRYGENPHQKGALYVEQYAGRKPVGLVNVKLLSGPELSFNNFLDLEAAWSTACDFPDPTIAIIKHTNPCGCCSNKDLVKAYQSALAADPVSAFGGIVACNRMMDIKLASEIDKTHYDCIIALDYDDESAKLLGRKKNLRLCNCEALQPPTKSMRLISAPSAAVSWCRMRTTIPSRSLSREWSPSASPHRAKCVICSLAGNASSISSPMPLPSPRTTLCWAWAPASPTGSSAPGSAAERAGDGAKGAVTGLRCHDTVPRHRRGSCQRRLLPLLSRPVAR